MKRSEMAEIMWIFVSDIESDYDCYLEKEHMSRLLSLMEAAGMSPPPYIKSIPNNGEVGLDGEVVEAWEPEDEEK
jgi:hypothetical protein